MTTVIKIVKINILALISFPLLLLSITAQLLMKALNKTMVLLGVVAAMLGLSLLNLLFNHPGSFFNGLGTFVAMLILFGAIIAIVAGIVFFFATVALSVLTAVVAVLAQILNAIFEFSHGYYSRLYDQCALEFKGLLSQEKSHKAKYGCFLWQMLKGFNWAMIKVFSAAYALSLVISAVFTAFCLISVHLFASKTFGIGIFAYLQLFPVVDVVFAVLYFVVIVLAVVLVVLSLGAEWREWGQLLKLSTQNYDVYRNNLWEKAQSLNDADPHLQLSADGKNAAYCQEHMDMLNQLFDEVDSLQQQLDTAMNLQHDSALLYEFTEYIETLGRIYEKMKQYPSLEVPFDIFETHFIPLIIKANEKQKSIKKRVFQIIDRHGAAAAKQETSLDFFAGCKTAEEVKNRYRALCKVYHPDVGGHEHTFKILQEQYERKIAQG